MAECIKIRRDLAAMGKELFNLEGTDLAKYVNEELQKIEQQEKEASLRILRGKEIELELEREKNKQRTSEADQKYDCVSPPPNNNQPLDPSMTFPVENFKENVESIDSWLQRFEELCIAYGLADSKRALKCSMHLRGESYAVYCSLSPTYKNDYSELKDALYRHYGISAESYRKLFRRTRKDKNETYNQLADKIDQYLMKWHSFSGLPDTKEGYIELIKIDQLRTSMTPDTRQFVDQQGVESLRDIIKYADRFESAREPMRHTLKNSKGDPETQKKETSELKGFTHPKKKIHCTYCGKGGHDSNDCYRKNPQKKPHSAGAVTQRQEDPDVENFTSADVPPVTAMVKVNNIKCRCLFDTGLDYHSVVAANLVRPDQMTKHTIQVQCASLDVPPLTLPIAYIDIDSPYVVGTIPAAVLEAPSYDVILGCRYVYLAPPKKPIKACAVKTRSQLREESSTEGSTTLNPAPAEMKEAQKQDQSLNTCFNKLPRAKDPPAKGDFIMTHGILHRVIDDDRFQLVVPTSYRRQVLELGHDTPLSGHMGIGATTQRITSHYYWPGINGDIHRYVQSCVLCQKKSTKTYISPVSLGEMPVTGIPFERVAADLVGPLPMTKNRNRFILTVVDTCSMWAEAVPLKRIDAKAVADAFLGIFTRLGFPKQILTDNGSQFCGKLMKEVYEVLNTQHITTSYYHPQANGQCERFNGTIISIIKKLVDDRPELWDTYITPALYAYREVPSASTGFSPAVLLFGRPITGPLDVLKQTWTVETLDETEREASKYVQELKEKLKHSWTVASKAIKKARARQRNYYNKHTKDRELQVGDKALLLLPEGQNKLQISWQGPYPVTAKLSRTNYTIRIRGKEKTFHINLLKKFIDREINKLMLMAIAEEVESTEDLALDYPIASIETHKDVQINPELPETYKQKLKELLNQHTETLTDKPGKTNLVEVSLELTDHQPIRCKPYPVPLAKEAAIDSEIDTMLASGIITPSDSPYSAPILLLRKPSGEHRMCIDYRKLNAVTHFIPEPLPDQNRMFAKIGKARFFSKLDLSKGYYQIPVPPEVRKYLAFSTHRSHYEFTVLPFGLHNAPSIFSKMMTKLLAPLNNQNILHFMDDVLIATQTWDQHMQALEMLLKRLRETGLTARPKNVN